MGVEITIYIMMLALKTLMHISLLPVVNAEKKQKWPCTNCMPPLSMDGATQD